MEKQTHKLKRYFWIIYIVFITDSLLFATNAEYTFIAIKRYITIIVALVFLFVKIYKHNKTYDSTIVILTLLLLLSMLCSGQIIGFMYFTQIAMIVFGICFCINISKDEFIRYYINFIRVVAIFSLICFLFPTLMSTISFVPTIQNTAGVSFKCYGFTNLPVDKSLWARNFGPFWEPGAYQLYLNIAFLFTLFRKNYSMRKKLLDAILFAFTCLTTKSGVSFIGLGIFLLAYLIYNNEDKRSWKTVVILFVGVGIICLLSSESFSRIFEKVYLGLDAEDNVSFGYRLSSAMTYIQGFLHSPLWGNSVEYLENLMKENMFMLIGQRDGGNTNTILSYFAYYGGIVGTFAVFNLYKSMYRLASNRLVALILLCGIIAITSNENFMYSSLLCVVMFFHLAQDRIDSHTNYNAEHLA